MFARIEEKLSTWLYRRQRRRDETKYDFIYKQIEGQGRTLYENGERPDDWCIVVLSNGGAQIRPKGGEIVGEYVGEYMTPYGRYPLYDSRG